jgi:uncharacterized glyoxalase superfamily metalloenzyme YdcJ
MTAFCQILAFTAQLHGSVVTAHSKEASHEETTEDDDHGHNLHDAHRAIARVVVRQFRNGMGVKLPPSTVEADP